MSYLSYVKSGNSVVFLISVTTMCECISRTKSPLNTLKRFCHNLYVRRRAALRHKMAIQKMGWLMGLEPTTSGVTIRCSTW